MKIYVVGSSKNKFLPLDNIREKFLIDQKHEGDNIDFLNPWYCELTGLYYLWKNCNEDIVGLEHYRRYFVNDNDQLLSENEIRDILKTKDIICTKSWDATGDSLEYRFHRGWAQGNLDEELKYLKFTIRYLYPNLYEEFISFLNSNTHWQFNMFICKKELINEYGNWVFNILETVYNNCKCKDRSIGFLCEICLFTFFIEHIKKLNVFCSKVKLCNFTKIGYR